MNMTTTDTVIETDDGQQTDNHREVIWSVLLAAGSGERFGAAKQFETLGDRRVVDWPLEVLGRHSDGVVLVVPDDDVSRRGGIAESHTSPVRVVAGGASRSASVRQAMQALPTETTIICVHDAARPFVPDSVLHAVIDAVRDGADGAVPGLIVTDTIKVVNEVAEVTATPDRATLRAVQTPQAFRANVLWRAHSFAADATDDAALVERGGGRVKVVAGDAMLRKITTPDDLEWARTMAQRWAEGEV